MGRMGKPAGCQYHVRCTTAASGWVVAQVLELPGALSQGRTMGEARDMARDAILELLASYREDLEATEGAWETLVVGAADDQFLNAPPSS